MTDVGATGSYTNPHTCVLHGVPLNMRQVGAITEWWCPMCAAATTPAVPDRTWPWHDARFTTCAMADARIAELTAENAALRARVEVAEKESQQQAVNTGQIIMRIERQRDHFHGALWKYGEHKAGCPASHIRAGFAQAAARGLCVCGFADALGDAPLSAKEEDELDADPFEGESRW
jgi:hypothetical protein